MGNFKETIVKILNQSTTNFDGEALVCIRKANALLAAKKTSWEELIIDEDPPEPTIEDMLNFVLGKSNSDFIASLSEQFWQKGYLSSKQQDALERTFKNLGGFQKWRSQF